MMRAPAKVVMQMIFLAIFSSAALAADIWYEDNNMGTAGGMPADFVSKFQQPETFQEASQYLNVYMVRAGVLESMSDDFLANVFYDYLKKHDIRLAIDAGGANWMELKGRAKIFHAEMELLKRLKRLGIKVDYISLQSVLSKEPRGNGETIDYPLDKRIRDVIAYAKAVQAIDPQIKIGIIDASPSQGKEYRQPYRLLKNAMDNEGMVLSYIHLDIPFDIPRDHIHGVTWQTIREVEKFVEEDLGLKFGYFTTSRQGGLTSSMAFHERVMAAMECYIASGGTPSEFVIGSWFPHPEKTIPENATGDDYPAMRTVREFGRELDDITKNGPSQEAQRARHPGWRDQCGMN